MKTEIKHVHFQITRKCNLRCEFCGQWGKKGFFREALGEEMTFADWERVIFGLMRSPKPPKITVWGGEPLVSPLFDRIMTILKENGFKTEVITNGVLIDKHIDVIKSCVDKLYVSIDGPGKLHDRVRGEGVYDKVTKNLTELDHKNVTVMSVITDSLIAELPEFLNELNKLNIRELLLQDMIGLSEKEAASYKKWMKDDFDIDAENIDSWITDEKINFSEDIKRVLAKNLTGLGYRVIHKEHIGTGVCSSPFTHPHISWNGEVRYCTDFYDFSAGNVKEQGLEEIFQNEKSEKFRLAIMNNRCSACCACSWRSE